MERRMKGGTMKRSRHAHTENPKSTELKMPAYAPRNFIHTSKPSPHADETEKEK